MIWIQPPLNPALTSVDFVERAPAVLGRPQLALLRVERHAEAVPDAVGEDALNVAAHLVAERAEATSSSSSVSSRRRRRGRCRRRPVVLAVPSAHLKNGLSRGVLPSSLRRRMTPVRCASSGAGPPKSSSGTGPSRLFCVKPRRPLSPMMMYSFPSGPKRQHAAVVVAAQHRQRRIGHVVAVVLERAQADDVPVEGQRAAVPHETVHAIAEQRHVPRATSESAPVVLSVL